jgi:hypothetical protein
MHLFECQDFVVADFRAPGYILDIGGEARGPFKIIMDATDFEVTRRFL